MIKANKVIIVKNCVTEGPGLIEEILTEKSIKFDIVDLDNGHLFPSPKGCSALVVLGGPDSANDETIKMKHELARIKEALDARIPYLGICLGMQALVKAAGGGVFKNNVKEAGVKDTEGNHYEIELTEDGKNDALLKGLGTHLKIFQLHGETVGLTGEMKLLATGKHCTNQIVKVGNNAYGIQGHFELTEEMLQLWLSTDSDLRKLDKSKLISDFDSAKEEYADNGRKLIDNFMGIAGLRLKQNK